MKILIVDDEKLARDRLARLIEKSEQHSVVGEASNGYIAIEQIEKLQPDIVLLDIRMPGMDGLEVARHLTKLDNPPAVIFCTAKKTAARQHISASTRHGLVLVPLTEVRCFIADHKYVTVYHTKGELLIDDALKDIEEEFHERFVRVHRNAVVSLSHVEGMEKTPAGHYLLRLQGTAFKPAISRRNVTQLRNQLKLL